MILNCKSCNARYLLSAEALGPDGRMVRCVKCSNEWFQDPEEEPAGDLSQEDGINAIAELARDNADDLEDIPEGVKPISGTSSLPIIPDGEEKINWGDVVGGSAAAVIFVIIFGILLMMQPSVVKSWPASSAFYNIIGMQEHVAGEGLVFDQLKAISQTNKKGDNTLYIKGNIVNLGRYSIAVPVVNVDLRLDDGSVHDTMVVEFSEKEIGADSSLSFNLTYPDAFAIEKVNVALSLADESGS